MTTTFQLTADGMTKQALQKCGVVGLGRQPDPAVLQDARDTLSTILKTLQARGTTLTQMVPFTISLTPGVAAYVPPSNIISVEDEVTTLLPGRRLDCEQRNVCRENGLRGLPNNFGQDGERAADAGLHRDALGAHGEVLVGS